MTLVARAEPRYDYRVARLRAALLIATVLFATAGTARADVHVEIVHENPGFVPLAVGTDGVAYGKSGDPNEPTLNYRLYRSTDEGRTWTPLYDFPNDSALVSIAVLSTGTLIATVNHGPAFLFRSDDGGHSWTQTMQFAVIAPGIIYTTLSPHSVTDDGTYAYVGSYNTLPDAPQTNTIWRSADDGRTWTVIRQTTTHRHIHFVQVDPHTGYLYAGYGDEGFAAIERSRDHGVTWQTLCSGNQCLAVDIAFAGNGFAVFGTDTPFEAGHIQRVNLASGTVTSVASLPGTSFSAFSLGGVLLIGTTHEPEPGFVYPPGDTDLHLLASDDGGLTFTDVFRRPLLPESLGGFPKLQVQYAFPNGDFLIQLSYFGTIVARLVAGPTVRPANLTLPTVLGSTTPSSLLSASTGTWSGAPTAFTYQWRRCNGSGSSCATIGGATAQTYTVASGDIGSTLRVVVTASTPAGSTAATSSATATVAPPPAPMSSTLPQIAGTATEGLTLAATAGTWSGTPTAFGFQWQRCNSSGSGCAAIAGATAQTYAVAAVDVGSTLRVAVTATNAGGSTAALSAVTAAVAARPSPPPAPPTGGGSNSSSGGGGGGGTLLADLSVRVDTVPAVADPGDPVTYYVTITDENGGTGTGILLTVNLPDGATVQSTYADRGSGCSGAPLVCPLDFLSGSSPTAHVTIVTRVGAAGRGTATFAVESSPRDPNSANNTVTGSYDVPAAVGTGQVTTPTPSSPERSTTRSPGQRAVLGIRRVDSRPAKPLRARREGGAVVVSGVVAVNGAVKVQVATMQPQPLGPMLLLRGSRLGKEVTAQARRNITVTASGSGRVEFSLRIPPWVKLRAADIRTVRVSVWDARGRRATISIPFRVPS